MDNRRKRPNPVIGVLAALYGIYLLYGIGSSMMDRYTMAQLTEHMKTACVGRFLIDLPSSMDHSYGQAFLDGLWISGQKETKQAFDARLLARKAQVDAERNELGQKNLERFEDYNDHGFEGKILVFGRTITKGIENGKPTEWKSVKLEPMSTPGEQASISEPMGTIPISQATCANSSTSSACFLRTRSPPQPGSASDPACSPILYRQTLPRE